MAGDASVYMVDSYASAIFPITFYVHNLSSLGKRGRDFARIKYNLQKFI